MRNHDLIEGSRSEIISEMIQLLTRKYYEDAIYMMYETGPGGPYRNLAGIGGHGIQSQRTLDAIDRHKFNIIKTMLNMAKNNIDHRVLGLAAKSLNEMGVTWPELDMFKKSAGLGSDPQMLPVREGLLDSFRGDEYGEVVDDLNDKKYFVALSLLGSDPDEVGEIEGPASYKTLKAFEKHKTELIRHMLTLVKGGDTEEHAMLYHAAKKMKNIGIKWPELNYIENASRELAKEWLDDLP